MSRVLGYFCAAIVVSVTTMLSAPAARPMPVHAGTSSMPPNIIVIVTDDQRFDSLRENGRPVMPEVQAELVAHGIRFDQAIASNALCCPSRAALLLGAYSHTSGVYTNNARSDPPDGAWPAFVATGDEDVTIARALHDAGYRTGLFGKYFNSFTGAEAPVGWDRFAAFLAQGDGGAYYDYEMLVDGPQGPRTLGYEKELADYSTYVIEQMAVQFLRETPPDRPFLLYVTPYAPHGNITPAPEDRGDWDDYVPRMRRNFNEDTADKPRYLSILNDAAGEFPEDRAVRWIRHTNETLAAVDRMVGQIMDVLRDKQVLSRTMIVFMSDNGISFGEHRWSYKMSPHEESIRVPMVIRYDRMIAARAGIPSHALVANVDIVPTIAEVAGVDYQGVGTIDGRSLVPLLTGASTSVRPDVLLEHLDFPSKHRVPTFCGVRTPRWVFARYDTGERELYDLVNDPYEMNNLAGTRPHLARTLLARTKALCDPPPPRFTWGS